jgi:hypothetical protein
MCIHLYRILSWKHFDPRPPTWSPSQSSRYTDGGRRLAGEDYFSGNVQLLSPLCTHAHYHFPMTTDVVALDTDVAPLGGGSGTSPAKSKLTCACVSRRDLATAALPSTVSELICVGHSTRRTDTYPPLFRHHHSNAACSPRVLLFAFILHPNRR